MNEQSIVDQTVGELVHILRDMNFSYELSLEMIESVYPYAPLDDEAIEALENTLFSDRSRVKTGPVSNEQIRRFSRHLRKCCKWDYERRETLRVLEETLKSDMYKQLVKTATHGA